MTSLLNSECLSGCVPAVLVGIGAPLFAWRPKESVSASCFSFWGWSGSWGVAGRISLRFLQDPGSDFGLSQPLPVALSVAL